jgi:putative MATE family efflux protein
MHQSEYLTDIPTEADIPLDADVAHGAVGTNVDAAINADDKICANINVNTNTNINTDIDAHNTDRVNLPLMHFAWPIMIENIIRVAITSADVIMLSSYAEEAVAATGVINQLVFLINLLYLMVASGASILISQNLGARNIAAAGRVAQGSITLLGVFSVALSASLCLGSSIAIGFFKLAPKVHAFAMEYFVIYSAGSVFVALCMVLATIVRSYGHSRGPMLVNVVAMAINVFGNYLFIFRGFGDTLRERVGLNVSVIQGVALSTVASQVAAAAILYWMMKRRKDIVLEKGGLFKVPGSVYRRILAVGVPTAGENLSYNLGQIMIMRMVSALGTDAMAAFVYAVTLLRFVFITSISIGSAVQIKVGYYVGAMMSEIAQRKVYRYFLAGTAISTALVLAVKLLQFPIINTFFTQNPGVQAMSFGVLLVALFHEPGRNFNVIIIPALKGAGDVRYPVYVGMIFMWGVGVTLAYVLGITLGWGLIGICIAMAADEWSRGVVIFFRWRGGRWKGRQLVG